MKYECFLHSAEYLSPPNELCPRIMRGVFRLDGHDAFKFEVMFDPMGGCWTFVDVNGKFLELSMSEPMHKQISDSAMSMALHNAKNPDDKWWCKRFVSETTYNFV